MSHAHMKSLRGRSTQIRVTIIESSLVFLEISQTTFRRRLVGQQDKGSGVIFRLQTLQGMVVQTRTDSVAMSLQICLRAGFSVFT